MLLEIQGKESRTYLLPICSKKFIVKPADEQVYCSKKCMGKSKEKKVECICEACGKKFLSYPSRIRIGKENIVQENAVRKQVELTCLVCGKKFKLPSSQAEGRKCCSKTCANKILETAVECTLPKMW